MDPITKTPKEIVSLLDDYVVGQSDAKKSISIALRNRYRRMQLPVAMQDEITPKNMLMIGPTGVGKTELARRLAKIVKAPFVKVEATKFTEVGYVGGDVESMVRSLADVAVKMEKDSQFENVRAEAARRANNRLTKLIVPGKKPKQKQQNDMSAMMNMFSQLQQGNMPSAPEQPKEEVTDDIKNERMSVSDQLAKGLLENREVEIEMDDPQQAAAGNNPMMNQMGIDLSDTLGQMMPKRRVKRNMPVSEAREVLIQEESEKLVNEGDINHDAIKRAENTGIIFIDEIDKIASKNNQNSGEVSREGVQRDILPIVEGTQVQTKYGLLSTDHILFIAAGAFAESKPSDLIAELQGRFPIRVELDDLDKDDFVRILTEPTNSLIKQYTALIGTDNIKVTFTMEAIERIAELSAELNHENQNIGARRLHTVLEKLLEDLLYEGPDMQMGDITITENYVNDKIGNIVKDKDLSRYIL
ncbi:ATP-dependent protease ATP-binding subunit HslU [Secundilactobacillus paracollinoides]|uniref:ATP-dependent protease ATPase subunit HslU n=1 Tax=Secundilactobacillus paracollinoides TaxID=240427 RepID=UPI0006F0804F|nr:ATP-dependent protease ATPase subunit HslU [Secundilactobacillus paracollinoides]ANZ63692.1 ATP-dependent protease ATP-binding subunit HslU [Secundilactobacillus paracollinoides]KRL75243.1 ATP-dependent protease ATP-binding subunit HslU [Secundilactobacillus paracollinoides DSM 15502 = JCM 11969]